MKPSIDRKQLTEWEEIFANHILYFAVYNEHFAQIFEGKIRMHIIHG